MSASNRPPVSGSGGTSEGTNVEPRRKFGKGDRSRRIWTVREEEILAASLLELVARGWKSDNGFRSGYQQKIEENIRKEFPKSDLKGTPHIVSKISAWKKNYASLRGILGRSGVGFNTDGDYKIDIDDDQWAQVVAVDRDARFMRNKSWPFWETWKSIFGKDCATGGASENIEVATSKVRAQMASGSQVHDNAYLPRFEDFIPDAIPEVVPDVEAVHSSSAQSEQAVSTTKIAGEKRKLPHNDEVLMDFLGNLHSQTNSRLDIISSRIGYEFDLGKAREEVFEKLGEVDGLTLGQRYEICNILGDKPQRLEIFKGIPATQKLGYVLMLIEEKRAGV